MPLRESKGEQYHLVLSSTASLPGDLHQGSAPEGRNNFLCHSARELSLGASTNSVQLTKVGVRQQDLHYQR